MKPKKALKAKVGFEKEREAQNVFEKWRDKKIHHVEQIATEAKRLKEFNEDCEDLGRQSKKCEEEKGLFLMCEKLSGRLYSVFHLVFRTSKTILFLLHISYFGIQDPPRSLRLS